MSFRKVIRFVPNILTSLRIAGAISLLFLEPFSLSFFIVYTACGITDVLDGFIARLAKCSSQLGARLDSIADLTFYAVMLLKILPVLLSKLAVGIWCWIGAVLALRAAAYIISACKHHRFAALHTYWNKATGLCVFLVPYAISTRYFTWFAVIACLIATLAVLDELRIHCTKPRENQKTTPESTAA